MKKRRLIFPPKRHLWDHTSGMPCPDWITHSLWKTVSYWSNPSGGPPRQSGGRSTGCMWKAEEYGLVEKRMVRETVLLSIILKWESPDTMEPDSSQWRVMTGQETTGKSLSMGSFSHHVCGWHRHRYPEKIWHLCPQKCSELVWIWPRATCCN